MKKTPKKNSTCSDPFFRVYIVILGLTMLGTLVYSLVAFPPATISHNMDEHIIYKILLTIECLLQIVIMYMCAWTKIRQDFEVAVWAVVTITIMLGSWIALSNVYTEIPHDVFVALFITSLLVTLLLFLSILHHWQAVIAVRVCICVVVICCIAMVALYNSNQFFIPEYIAFISYSIIFIAMFVMHPYSHWDVMPDEEEIDTLWDESARPGESCCG